MRVPATRTPAIAQSAVLVGRALAALSWRLERVKGIEPSYSAWKIVYLGSHKRAQAARGLQVSEIFPRSSV